MSTWLRLTLVTMTVGGGFAGLAGTSQALFALQRNEPAAIVIYTLMTFLYAFVLVSGLLFVHNSQRTTSLVVALALQTPAISSPIIAFQFAAGLSLQVGFSENGFLLWTRLGMDWRLMLLHRFPWGIGVNLIPVALLAALALSNRRGLSK